MAFLRNNNETDCCNLFCFTVLIGALKEIQTRIPAIVRLYSLGNSPTAMVSAVNLDKALEESSPGRPVLSHSKSFAGKKRRQN